MAIVMSMANDGRDVHPFFMPKANAGNSTERDIGINDKHRKRQRTEPVSQEVAVPQHLERTEWIDQLNAAASGALQGMDATGISTNHQGEGGNVTTAMASVRRGSTESSVSARSGIPHASPTVHPQLVNADIPIAQEISKTVESNSNRNTIQTPPKKMLKVRSDGKLLSPKAKAPAQDAKPKRGRKSTKAETIRKTLISTIIYGTDAQSRSSIGRKIANIFSGTASVPSSAKAKPSRPPEPLKPTHPFFLGGSKRDQCQQDIAQSKDGKDVGKADIPIISKPKNISPTKARVTSKPPGMAERSTGVFEFKGNTLSADHPRSSRSLGTMEPLWPPEGMTHVRQDIKPAGTYLPLPHHFCASKACRKLKGAEVRIPKEEQVLTQYVDVVQAYRSDDEVSRRVHSREWRDFRRPLRRIVTGRELQQAVRGNLSSNIPTPNPDLVMRQNGSISSTSQLPHGPSHPAVLHMYKEIGTSSTAFDKFECETQDWMHKYAPNSADQVLQAGREALILRDWLRTLTVNSVDFRVSDSAKTGDSSTSSRRTTAKRKKRRAEELDGFVLSSDDEVNEMCQVTDSEDTHPSNSMLKKSVVRSRVSVKTSNGERVTNAVVVSGPHGCGKTAAVNAVARELGFEVFEINAGSRRSGRDILDKVGDMTRNHLVKHAHLNHGIYAPEEEENVDLLSEKLKQDLESGRQGTMKSFFKSKGAPKKSPSKKKPKVQKTSPKQDSLRKHQSQKQSLILLEEVDVLFEEDKAFWATILDLLVQSKRPVIMTCTDESLLPLDDMILYAILRFTHAPVQLATDYLLLVACNEGHLLSREAVIELFRSKNSDLRASMTELNFFCQMAIGDTKGGLEWMLIKPSSTDSNEQNQDPLRVVSEGTYQTGMGWLSAQDQISLAECSVDQEIEILSEAWNGWGQDIGACEAYLSPSTTQEPSRMLALEQLQILDQVAESFSAADTFPGRIPQTPDMVSLDTTRPELTEKARSNYVEGFSLSQADPVIDETGVAAAIAFAVKAFARRSLQISDSKNTDTAFSNGSMVAMITENMQAHNVEESNMRLNYAAAFVPIARSNKPVLGIPKGPQISVFDGPLSVTTEDLAPYVRSIASYDLRLEEQRRLLSSLLLRPGHNNKRQRTTRASRAALEGGSKAYTRRERWFPKTTNLDAVLRSGGKDWQDIALRLVVAEQSEEETELDEASRRGSIESVVTESDR